MKFKELKELNKNELVDKIKEIKLELMKDYAQISAGTPAKNPGMIKQRKKTIAKILTLLREKEGDDK